MADTAHEQKHREAIHAVAYGLGYDSPFGNPDPESMASLFQKGLELAVEKYEDPVAIVEAVREAVDRRLRATAAALARGGWDAR